MLFKTLRSGKKFPALGLGTWQSKGGDLQEAVIHAVKIGYRHFDTATAYQNEGELGKAFKRCFDEGLVKREDLFVTSKLWNISHAPCDVRKACEETLKLLGFDYLDLYLVHWPMGYINNGELFPKDQNGKFLYSDVDYLDTWKAMEKLVADGLVRDIGLSNFNQQQIQRIVDNSSMKPAVLQVECHPYLQQEMLVKYAASRDIVFTAYSPFGAPERPWTTPNDPKVLDNPVLHEIGKKYGKSAAQVVIKFMLQRGVTVIPKSVTPSRLAQNFEVFDFQINDEDMKTIASLNRNDRHVVLDWFVCSNRFENDTQFLLLFKNRVSDHPHFPFKEE